MPILIRTFDELSSKELYYILKARQEVFVVEQKIVYLDLDEKDFYSFHFSYYDQEPLTILSYLRMVPDRQKKEISIGRVLTLPSARSQGLARQMMKKAIEYWQVNYSSWNLHLHAQEHLQSFYQSLGFEATGPVFYFPNEDPLPHIPMLYKKSSLELS